MSAFAGFSVCLVLTTLFTPIAVYALILWHRFRYHYIIRERYPRVCYIIIISAYLCAVVNTISFYLLSSTSIKSPDYIGVASVAVGLGFIVYIMTVYRALLVFLRWKVVQKQLSFYISTNERSDDKRPDFQIHVNRNAIAIAYVVYAVIALLFVIVTKIFSLNTISATPWTIQTFVGIIIISATFYYKVKEAIGCLTECYVFVTGLVIFYAIEFAVIPLFGLSLDDRELFVRIFSYTIMSFAMFMTLLNSLRIIYNSEHTLNYEAYKKIHAHVITDTCEMDEIRTSVPSFTTKNSGGTGVTPKKRANMEKLGSVSSLDFDRKNEEMAKIDLSLSIFQFLNAQESYAMYMEYLGYCFAIESLLFVQRVSIFHNWIVQRFESDLKPVENSNGCRGRKHLYRTKFQYLISIWEQYSEAIPYAVDDDCIGGLDTVVVMDETEEVEEKQEDEFEANDEKLFMKHRHSLFVMCREICEEFIYDQAPQQINIPYEVQQALLFMLVTDDNITKFSCIADFLYLFDDAMSESYFLLGSIYKFKFKCYVKAKFGQQVILERLMNSFLM